MAHICARHPFYRLSTFFFFGQSTDGMSDYFFATASLLDEDADKPISLAFVCISVSVFPSK